MKKTANKKVTKKTNFNTIVVLKYEKKKTKRHKDKIEWIFSNFSKKAGHNTISQDFCDNCVHANSNALIKNGNMVKDVWDGEFQSGAKNLINRELISKKYENFNHENNSYN